MFHSIKNRCDAFFSRPLVTFGGEAYLGGNLLLLATGGLGSAWNEVAGAATFLLTSAMYRRSDDNPALFAAASALCIPAMISTNAHELIAGTTATIIGTGVYTAGSSLGVASQKLTQQFESAGNALVRNTFGEPRKWMGGLCLGSKGFMLHDALVQHQWDFLGVLLFWSAGDVCVGLSSAKARLIQNVACSVPRGATLSTRRRIDKKVPKKPFVCYRYRKASPKA